MDKSPIKIEQFAGVPTVREFATYFMENYAQGRNKHSELVSKRQILDAYILPMFGDFRLDQVTNAHTDVFVARSLAAGAKPKSINNRLAVLNKMLNYAHSREIIKNTPTWDPLPVETKEARFLDRQEAVQLLESAAEDGPIWYGLVALALFTGMRSGELRALKWSNVKLERGLIQVRKAEWRRVVSKPKSKAGIREIPINAPLRAALNAIKPIGELVFCLPNSKGRVIAHETSRNRMRKIARRAGVRKCQWHTLRHTFASWLVMRGTPLHTVQRLMGHATLQMTLRYAHLAPEAKSEATDILADVFRAPKKSKAL